MALGLLLPTVVTFLLLFVRMSGLMTAGPLLSNASIPPQFRIGLGLAVTLLLFPLHATAKGYVPPSDVPQLVVMALQEFIIGAMLGYSATLVFNGIQMAGELISMQMGLSVSNVLDPVTRTSQPLIGQLFFFLAVVVFLSLNIHHVMLMALNRSFEMIPLGHGIHDWARMADRFIVLTGQLFVVTLLVAVPTVGLLLAVETAMGILSRLLPQMNIFIVGMPVKILVALGIMSLALPMTAQTLSKQFAELSQVMLALFRHAG